MNNLTEFINRYSVAKTLQFELKPVGKTLQNFNDSGFLESEADLQEKCLAAQEEIDQLHKQLLEESLKGVVLDWKPLASAIGSKDAKAVADESTALRKSIVAAFKKHPFFANLTASTPKKLFEEELKEKLGKDNVLIVSLSNKATMLQKYSKIRSNLYGDEDKASSAANRIVGENFPRFLYNIRIFERIVNETPEIVTAINDAFGNVEDSFIIDAYNNCVCQTGIDIYNTYIGGYTEENGVCHQGLNSLINEYNQRSETAAKAGELKDWKKLPMLRPLYKQLLSDADSVSFIPEKIEDDNELLTKVEDMVSSIRKSNIFGKLQNEIELLRNGSYGYDDVYIVKNRLADISNKIFGSWNYICEKMEEASILNNKKHILTQKEKERIYEAACYKLSEITDVVEPQKLFDYWNDAMMKADAALKGLEKIIDDAREKLSDKYRLREDESFFLPLKECFDELVNVINIYKALYIRDKKLSEFSVNYYPLIEQLRNVSKCYDLARNYITRKVQESAECLQLNFGYSSFGDGWSDGVWDQKGISLFREDGHLYLCIFHPKKASAMMKTLQETVKDSPFQRLSYNTLDYKFISKYMFFTKESEKYYTTLMNRTKEDFDRLCQQYQDKVYKNADKEGEKVLQEMMAYFKKLSTSHKALSKYNVCFKDNYMTWGEFVDDVSSQFYLTSWVGVDKALLEKNVEEGNVYMFEIWCRDFSDKAEGKKDLFTMFFEACLSDDNMIMRQFDLLGGASVFFRKRLIENPVCHKVGTYLVNRRTSDDRPIPSSTYLELYRYINGMSTAPLSKQAKEYLPYVVKFKTGIDITKDRRYTADKFLLHVTVKCNPLPDNTLTNDKAFNERVREWFKSNPDAHIVSINRGQNNLLYAMVIDKEGRIIDQKSLNVINGTDYKKLLAAKAGEREDARKNWKTINKIEDLKKGYLSCAIHEICDMILKYQALVVMEDLTSNFKSSFDIDKNIYVRFESALYKKLQYLCTKDDVTMGYQLVNSTVPPQDKLNFQKGFIFFVNPFAITKTDPVTGFISPFNFGKSRTVKQTREFIDKFDSITFDGEDFIFEMDESKFGNDVIGENPKHKWTLTSRGRRIVARYAEGFSKKVYVDVYPSQMILEAMKFKNITPVKGSNLIGSNILNENIIVNTLYDAIRYMCQVRNYRNSDGIDEFLSPVVGGFDSTASGNLKIDSCDGNATYNLARKALWLIYNDKNAMSIDDWRNFCQNADM